MNFSFSSSSSRLEERKTKTVVEEEIKREEEESSIRTYIIKGQRGNSFPSLSHSRKKKRKIQTITKEKENSGHSLQGADR
jgi:hypothetical protein